MLQWFGYKYFGLRHVPKSLEHEQLSHHGLNLFPGKTNSWSHLSTSLSERKLRLAASTNNTEMMFNLITTKGVDVNAPDEQQRTALHFAASKGYSEAVNLLLQHGAKPNNKVSYHSRKNIYFFSYLWRRPDLGTIRPIVNRPCNNNLNSSAHCTGSKESQLSHTFHKFWKWKLYCSN